MTRSQTSASRPEKTGGRQSPVKPPRPTDRAPQSGQNLSDRGLEWLTERWKRDVEAEARRQLKKGIRGVGRER